MGRNVPQLRFPEFTAEWEEKTLGDIGKFRKGKLVSSSNVTDSGVPAMMYGDIYVKYNIDFDSVDYRVSEEMAENCVKIHKGDLLFTCSGETDIDIAKCVCYTGSDEVCIGGDILALTPEKDDSLFVAQHQNTYKTAVQKARVSQGHSVVHIYEQQLSALPIHLPCKEEQEKISQFLSKYDKLIRNQEEKISALKERKQGLLKKIFTQQVRFKDQDGNDYPAWEEKKLGDYAIINPKTETLADEFYYIDLESVETGNLNLKDAIEKENAPSRAQRVLSLNDVLFQTVRPYQKNHLHYTEIFDKQVVASTGYAQMRVEKGDNRFLYQLLYTDKFNYDVNLRCTGSNYPAINSSELSAIRVTIPCEEEQKKIADVLSAFDKKIEVEQEILNNMQEFKKGLLQKMFI